jgi:hypothetical protein
VIHYVLIYNLLYYIILMSGEGQLKINEIDFRDASNNILVKMTATSNTLTMIGFSSSTINIKDVTDPIEAQDVATKNYVDTAGGGGSVAGSNTEIQFNNEGSFGAEATFTYNKSTNDLNLISSNSSVIIGVESGTGIISGVTATTADTTGGALSVTSGAGNGTGDGGGVSIIGGNGGITDSSIGGSINITGGTSSATNGDGGDVSISGGALTGSGTAGKILFPNIRTGISGNSAAIATGGELVDTVSLRRYKKKEVLVEYEPKYDINSIFLLEPKFFTWKQDGVRDMGFIVEDVLNVSDAYIYRDRLTNEPKNIKDRAIIAGLVAVVKEQQKLIEKQINDFYNLKTKLYDNNLI